MTVQELEKSDKMFLTPSEVAKIIGCDVQTLRATAYQQAETGKRLLNFPVTVIGKRIRIPRIPLLKYINGETKGVDE